MSFANQCQSAGSPLVAGKGLLSPLMKDLTSEMWREYEWSDPDSGRIRCYRIHYPKGLIVGNTTHRVLDCDGIVHCVPNVGRFGCVLRWQNHPNQPAVTF